MKIFDLLFCFAIVLGSVDIVNAEPITAKTCREALAPPVEAKLLPVLRALDAAAQSGDWFDKRYEDELEKLLKASDKDSQKARVALMDYYIGEHMAEELVCAVALDGNQVVSLLKHHVDCDVAPAYAPVPRNRKLPLRKYALDLIKGGQKHVKDTCTYDQ